MRVTAPDVRPKWCNVHQHHKWCEHNGGVMGPTGYAAPDVQAQIDAAVARERERIVELVELKRAKFNIGTRASLALNDVLDQIRARSAKGA